MPKLVKLYIQQVAIGFALAVVFVGMLLWANVANLAHLVFNTSGGYLALFLLIFFNGIVFGGVQFAIAIMRMAGRDDDTSGGKPLRDLTRYATNPQPIAIPVHRDDRRG
ncbi:hypothetical protein [Roseicitreum antarcticum]|uniref:Uncharacterized protein n=1 Tax=Roseicitreum antarcticum TaxID=564137 RepID=A0A1H2ZU28_9RHOB|nr:hypothetical protein [Roseicitreum antarcticum]SDX20865.1 hypothetical protein SAMN04488238_10669 [Roseicitreum antarcticum]